MEITTIGLDIAKNVFQVHAANAAGVALVRRKLRRADLLKFFEICRAASSASRPAVAHITGHAKSPGSDTM